MQAVVIAFFICFILKVTNFTTVSWAGLILPFLILPIVLIAIIAIYIYLTGIIMTIKDFLGGQQ